MIVIKQDRQICQEINSLVSRQNNLFSLFLLIFQLVQDVNDSAQISHLGALFIIEFNNFTILDNHRESSASSTKASSAQISSKIQLLDEISVEISNISDLIVSSELFSKGLKNERIVDSKSENSRDTSFFNFLGSFNVFRNVSLGASRGKSTYKL